jgi:hypothetical protein
MSDSRNGQTSTEWVTHRDSVTVGTEEWERVLDVVAPLLHLERPQLQGDRMISLNQVAQVAGVAKGTPIQWRQRTAKGELVGPKAFPEPDDDLTFPDKPLWKLSTIVSHLIDTNRWPPGAAGRPSARGPRGPRQPRVVEAELVR